MRWLLLLFVLSPVMAQDAGVDGLDPDKGLSEALRLRIYRQTERRKQEITRREAELAQKEARLKVLQADVEARYKALRMLQEKLTAVLKAEADAAPKSPKERAALEAEAGARVRRLAKVFGKMKAGEAAKVVEAMDEGLVVQVLSAVKPRQAAKILGAVEPKRAARLSERMGRRDRRKGKGIR